jgi:hypothetical protein
MEQGPFSKAESCSTSKEIPPPYMEHGLVPWSQDPVICSQPEPDESSHHPVTLFP